MPKHVAILHIIHIKLQLVIFEFTSFISLLIYVLQWHIPRNHTAPYAYRNRPWPWKFPVVKLIETRSGTSGPNTTQSVTIQVFNETAFSALVLFVCINLVFLNRVCKSPKKKQAIRFVMSVRPTISMQQLCSTLRSLTKFETYVFPKNLSRKLKFY